jgi:hypothetical protein
VDPKHAAPEQNLSSFASLKNITVRILRQRVVIETFQCLAEFENYVTKTDKCSGSCFPYTTNEGPVKVLYKYLFPIYVFPEMKLLFLKQNYNVLSHSSYTHISVRDLYISRIGLPILLQGNMWTNPGNI